LAHEVTTFDYHSAIRAQLSNESFPEEVQESGELIEVISENC